MTTPDADPGTAAAEAYEALLVPALFRQWAAPVADAARLGPGDDVLDVACGTGVLAREAARRVGPEGSVTGVDRDAGMLAVAARLAPEVDWREGTAESLPLPDASCDAVVSQFGMMFFPDRAAAAREMARVLRPGGRLAAAVWGGLGDAPGYAAEVELVERIAGADAANALRAPFSLGDPAEAARPFVDAGLAAVAVSTLRGVARFPGVHAMLAADVEGWLPLVGVAPTGAQAARIYAEGEDALGPFVTADGTVESDVAALVVTAVEP